MKSIAIRSFEMSLLVINGLVMLSFSKKKGLVMLSSVVVAIEDVVPLPSLPALEHDYLENCGTKLHPNCGEEIKAAVFAKRKISGACCKDLVAEERACHDKFVEVAAPYYPEPVCSEAPAKSAQAWDSCAAISSKS